ncbi:hypothetical protein FGO68_gene8849 [Halteria grandinella]|uniref:Uncharacterized protein n=1 Tax=Halteria grandinella TaxID=5974 RepID=A0A8J8P6C2_HALGN|nr:hypothetical protein FGO68_gene8849 [Halteria grandinella]
MRALRNSLFKGHCKKFPQEKYLLCNTAHQCYSNSSQSHWMRSLHSLDQLICLQSRTESIESIRTFFIRKFPARGTYILNLEPILFLITALSWHQPSKVQSSGLKLSNFLQSYNIVRSNAVSTLLTSLIKGYAFSQSRGVTKCSIPIFKFTIILIAPLDCLRLQATLRALKMSLYSPSLFEASRSPPTTYNSIVSSVETPLSFSTQMPVCSN